jgi:hypothetical protein
LIGSISLDESLGLRVDYRQLSETGPYPGYNSQGTVILELFFDDSMIADANAGTAFLTGVEHPAYTIETEPAPNSIRESPLTDFA